MNNKNKIFDVEHALSTRSKYKLIRMQYTFLLIIQLCFNCERPVVLVSLARGVKNYIISLSIVKLTSRSST